MRVEVKYGEGATPYFSTIINSTVEMCKLLNGTVNNPLGKWMIDTFSPSVPKGFFHSCPYVGLVQAMNVSISSIPVLKQFLIGLYKIIVQSFDEEDENIITFKLEAEVKRGRMN